MSERKPMGCVTVVVIAALGVAAVEGVFGSGNEEAARVNSSVAKTATASGASPEQKAAAGKARAKRQQARDRRRATAVDKTWNEDPFLEPAAQAVGVNRGTITIVAAPEEPGSTVTVIPSLCDKTLADHRWLRRLRVRDTSGKTIYHGLRGDRECSQGAIPAGRKPASSPAPKPEPPPLSNDELAVTSFNEFIRLQAPDAPWDETIEDVYLTGSFTSTLTMELSSGYDDVAVVMCRAAHAWMGNTNYRFTTKAKIYSSMSSGRRELSTC